MKLDDAQNMDLQGESVETTIVLFVSDDHRFHVKDSGTNNSQVDQYIRNKLDNKKVWTRKVKTNFNYFLTVRFEPEK
jgi:hypothetical protein